ncbi:MAG: hypothetical protein ACE5NG_08005 [bacterium]
MGKALLIIIVGFSTIFSGMMYNITSNQQRSSQAILTQYEKWIARNAIESVTNVANSKLYQNPDWQAGISGSFNGASYTVNVTDVTGDSTTNAKKDSITTIVTYENQSDTTITILVQPAYSYYYFFLNNWPLPLEYDTGDTVIGPIHSNTKIRISNSPVFLGKVSSAENTYQGVSNPSPEFYGGAEFGTATIDFSSVILAPLTIVGMSGGDHYPNEIWLEFNGTTYDVYSDPYITLQSTHNITDFNRIIMTDAGSKQDIHVRGTVDGQITILSDRNILIEDDIVCTTDPSSDPSSEDLIGLIAGHRVILVDNVANNSDLVIHAAIVARHDQIQVENPGGASRGTLTIVGSIVENHYVSLGTSLSDYVLNHIYDSRLIDKTPPYFPRITNRVEQIYRSD